MEALYTLIFERNDLNLNKFEVDSENDFHVELARIFDSDSTADSEATIPNTATNANTRDRRQVQSILGAISSIMAIGAFGMSSYSNLQLQAISEATKRNQANIDIIAHQDNTNAVRINNLTAHFSSFQEEMLKSYKGITNLSQQVQFSEMRRKLHQVKDDFYREQGDYMNGLQHLMDHCLTPGFLDMKQLKLAYRNFLRKARSKGLRPLSEEVGGKDSLPVQSHHCFYG